MEFRRVLFRSKVANAAVDPLAGSSDVSSAIAQIGTYTNVLSGVAATGSDYTLDYNPPNSLKPFWNSGTSTYTFPAGIYTIKKLKLSGGIKAVFQGYSTITISGGIDHGGASLTFGDGPLRSEERRVGKECVRQGRSRGWPCP